jgi:hypothetical protein
MQGQLTAQLMQLRFSMWQPNDRFRAFSSSNRAGPADRETAIILAPRCGRFPWTVNHRGFAFDRWIQCWVRKSGCVCPIKPTMTDRKSSPTTMPPFFGLMRKAVFYQRTAGSSSTKEPQEAPRESQCVQRLFTPTQMQLINSSRAQITYIEQNQGDTVRRNCQTSEERVNCNEHTQHDSRQCFGRSDYL